MCFTRTSVLESTRVFDQSLDLSVFRFGHSSWKDNVSFEAALLFSREAMAGRSPGIYAGVCYSLFFRSPEGGDTKEYQRRVSPPSGLKAFSLAIPWAKAQV